MKTCKQCLKVLSGRKRVWCSDTCRAKYKARIKEERFQEFLEAVGPEGYIQWVLENPCTTRYEKYWGFKHPLSEATASEVRNRRRQKKVTNVWYIKPVPLMRNEFLTRWPHAKDIIRSESEKPESQ